MQQLEAEEELKRQSFASTVATAKATGDILYEQGIMGFDAMRAMAYAEAVVNAHLAASKAMASLPPPFNFAAAGAAYAYAFARATQIKNMEPPERKREMGGSVYSGQSYLVGERGPEMFTPGTSGNITPNSGLGGSANITFNVNANDTAGFDDLLRTRRGMIMNLINEALNEDGLPALSSKKRFGTGWRYGVTHTTGTTA